MTRRSPHTNAAVTAALRDVAVIDAALVGLSFAREVITQRGRLDPGTATVEANAMAADLHRRRADALHRVMQFGALTADPDLRREAFKKAAGYLAERNVAIMQYLQVDGVSPSRWAENVEEEFRAELVAAFAELNGGSDGAV